MGKEQRLKKWMWAGLGVALGVGLVAFLRRRLDRQTIQRKFWRPVYDRLAKVYDAVDWFTGNTTHRLRQPALRYLPPAGQRVLEIGFGSGRLHLEVAAEHQAFGLDRALGMARLAAQRLRAQASTPRLCVGDVMTLPYVDAQFDAVLSTFAFSAFPDADRAMDEMVRVLKPGGKLIIVDAGEALDGNPVARVLAWLWELMGDYMRDEVPLMEARGLSVQREDYGPWHSVHVVVGTRCC